MRVKKQPKRLKIVPVDLCVPDFGDERDAIKRIGSVLIDSLISANAIKIEKDTMNNSFNQPFYVAHLYVVVKEGGE